MFLDKVIFNKTKVPVLNAVLDVTQLRQRVIANNIANVSTKGYRKQDVQFKEYLESFVRKRGNLKEMERELGASYQELRKRLNAIIGEMGFEAGAEEEIESDLSDRRRAILEQLDRGELDANGAAEALSKTKE